MIRITLTPTQREELRDHTRAPGITPRTRDRLEMVRLADAGWSIPRIARHLDLHEYTVRNYVKAFLQDGFAALPDRPHLGRPRRVTDAHLAAIGTLLDAGGRTWTTRQLVDWLDREHGVRVHPDYLSALLRRHRFSYKRTVSSVAHKRRDPDGYAAKVADLGEFKKKRRPA